MISVFSEYFVNSLHFSWTQQCMWTHAYICTVVYRLRRGSLQCVTPSPTMPESVPSNMSLFLGGLLPYVVSNLDTLNHLFEIMQQYYVTRFYFLTIITTFNKTFTAIFGAQVLYVA